MFMSSGSFVQQHVLSRVRDVRPSCICLFFFGMFCPCSWINARFIQSPADVFGMLYLLFSRQSEVWKKLNSFITCEKRMIQRIRTKRLKVFKLLKCPSSSSLIPYIFSSNSSFKLLSIICPSSSSFPNISHLITALPDWLPQYLEGVLFNQTSPSPFLKSNTPVSFLFVFLTPVPKLLHRRSQLLS